MSVGVITREAVAFRTPLGWMALAAEDGVIERITFGHLSATDAAEYLNLHKHRRPKKSEQAVVDQLRKFAEGRRHDFSRIQLVHRSLTPFQQAVVDACIDIPWGETLTYGQLATIAGSPGAARAIGNVMAQNPFPLVIPCHRVVGANNCLGGYSAPEGLDMKRRLLDREQTPLVN